MVPSWFHPFRTDRSPDGRWDALSENCPNPLLAQPWLWPGRWNSSQLIFGMFLVHSIPPGLLSLPMRNLIRNSGKFQERVARASIGIPSKRVEYPTMHHSCIPLLVCTNQCVMYTANILGRHLIHDARTSIEHEGSIRIVWGQLCSCMGLTWQILNNTAVAYVWYQLHYLTVSICLWLDIVSDWIIIKVESVRTEYGGTLKRRQLTAFTENCVWFVNFTSGKIKNAAVTEIW